MADAVLDAACAAYLASRSLPATAPGVAALAAFAEAQAPRMARAVRHDAEPAAAAPSFVKVARPVRRRW